VRERQSRRDFLKVVVFGAGASLALAGGVKPSPVYEVGTPSGKTLDELLTELSKFFGRHKKWRLRCKEQNATTEADLIRLAEQVLAEPCTGTVTDGYSHWLRLNGTQSIPCPYPYATDRKA
jgi:hypothetical protein